ncbi:MAG: diacylglycerol kinase [Crocinitomix sp.]|nr:diacylglycerol kinase [Crocinitomix sp.]
MMNVFNKTIASFACAFKGLATLIKEERNARIHLIATVVVIIAGVYFKLNLIEWCFIVFAIGLVFIVETINTVIENMMDYQSVKKDPKIAKIKDLAAAAVLIAAIVAVAIACFVFLPKIWVI